WSLMDPPRRASGQSSRARNASEALATVELFVEPAEQPLALARVGGDECVQLAASAIGLARAKQAGDPQQAHLLGGGIELAGCFRLRQRFLPILPFRKQAGPPEVVLRAPRVHREGTLPIGDGLFAPAHSS